MVVSSVNVPASLRRHGVRESTLCRHSESFGKSSSAMTCG